jgi:3-oxoacyl-[acyl-carrier protein] reductase
MVIVTGASKGIGLAIGKHLTDKGIEVIGLARTLTDVPFKMRQCDVSDPKSIKEVVASIRKVPMDGLINAAGIASMNLAITTPTEITRKIIETNLLGTIYCCQMFSPLMIKSKPGSIINFSTIAVSLGLKGESIYVASKAGIEGFSKSFAREMADFDITVNTIAPGPIATSLLKGLSDEQIMNVVSKQIITKQFTTDTICDIVDLLLDIKSRSLTGQVFHIGGA